MSQNPKDCVALDLLGKLQSNDEEELWLQEQVARDATGIAYAGELISSR